MPAMRVRCCCACVGRSDRGGRADRSRSEKDCGVLLPAYDDSAGVTAEFNRNILVRINRELDGQFAAAHFRHVAR